VKKAQVTFNNQNSEPSVQLNFSDAGAKKFADITKRNIKKLVGIFLDKDLLTAPVVQTEILDGTAIITGQFTVDTAKSLAVSINSGALPVPIRLVQNETVGPSLGALDVQRSVFAGVVGLIGVVLFMILYYGRLGLVASLGLILYGLITHALFRAVPVVLTLPGIDYGVEFIYEEHILSLRFLDRLKYCFEPFLKLTPECRSCQHCR
jgi:preprotein translocase subunit SecD